MRALPITYTECDTIYGQTVDKGLQSVLFVSAKPGEGVSTIAYAVAQRAAANGKRVLFLDFNTRSSFPRDVLCLPAMTWSLSEEIPKEAFVPIREQGLTFLPAPIERSFGLEARQYQAITNVMKRFTDSFDVVIGDAPCLTRPNGYAVPPAVLVPSFDGIVLVVAAGSTSKDAVQKAVAVLQSASARIVGCVLNDCGSQRLSDEIIRQFDKLGRLGRGLRWLSRPLIRRLEAIEGQF